MPSPIWSRRIGNRAGSTGFPSLGTWQFRTTAARSYTDTGTTAASALGDRVRQLNDIGGSNHVLSADAGTSRPVYVPSCPLSGKPAIRMAYGTQSKLLAPAVSVNSRNFTFYVIWRPLCSGEDSLGLFNLTNASALTTPMIDLANGVLRSYLPLNSAAGSYIYGNPLVTVVTGSASAISCYRNNTKFSLAAFDAATGTGGALFHRGDGYRWKHADIYEFGMIDAVVPDAGVAAIVTYAEREYRVQHSWGNFFAITGNSLTEGETDNTVTGESTGLLVADTLGRQWKCTNAGIAGLTTPTLNTRAAWAIDPLLANVTGAKIVAYCGGTNDLYLDAQTGAQTYARMVSFVNARRSAGASKVLLGTVVNRAFVSDPGDLNGRLADTNTLIRAGAGVDHDGVIELNLVPQAVDPTNTTFFDADALHWKRSLRAIFAPVIYNAVVAAAA